MIEQRSRSLTDIQYVIIGDDVSLRPPTFPPILFSRQIMEFIKGCPIDLTQLSSSEAYHDIIKLRLLENGYDIHAFKTESFWNLKEQFESSNRLTLFFLDDVKGNHAEIYHYLLGLDNLLFYYQIYGSTKLEGINIVNSVYDFVLQIVENQSRIFSKIYNKKTQGDDFKLSVQTNVNYKGFNPDHNFSAAFNNSITINQLTGNLLGGTVSDDEKLTNATMEAISNQNSFSRQNIFPEQIFKIDIFTLELLNDEVLELPSPSNPMFSPLILVFPFHNPDLKKLYPGKFEEAELIIDLIQSEQTENYVNLIEPKPGHEEKAKDPVVMLAIRERLRFLDDISYFHSSFTLSPVIRVPLKGKFIYDELSFFRAETFSRFFSSETWESLNKMFKKFGRKLSASTMSNEVCNVLKARNGQIVAISDLPIEWLDIDGIPISFSHDVCRMPETTLNGLAAFYMANKYFKFKIGANILEKTLLIIGTEEQEFQLWQKKAKALAKTTGFHIAVCDTLDKVKNAIRTHDPMFLLFDCHGGFDEETHSSFLYIGNEKLTSKFVVDEEISCPLVFISACGTAPTYGTMNPIANAFFEAGALSVTSTFFPILVDSGSILYLRILNNLSTSVKEVMHKNWLQFISHNLRTSILADCIFHASMDLDKSKQAELQKLLLRAMGASMNFENRRNIFKELDQKISAITKTDKTYLNERPHEYMIYTNMGRSDLILFENWEKKFFRLNPLNKRNYSVSKP